MKNALTVVTLVLPFLFAASITSFAGTERPHIYRCQYSVNQDGKRFTMSGSIISADANSEKNGSTYLSLEPPKTSGIDITARILITKDHYNPMRLHPRGDTVRTLASALLDGDEQEVSFEDKDKNAVYYLYCQLNQN